MTASTMPEAQRKDASQQSTRAVASMWCAAAILPAVLVAILIQRHWVSVPLLDDWEMAPLIVKAHTGTLTFADVFVQHAEARNILPKLLFVLFAAGGRWDVRVEMTVGFLFCCATLGCLYVLLRQTHASPPAAGLALGLMSLLIFSPAQHEVWLLASGFYSFLPILCIAAGLVAVGRSGGVLMKFGVCVVAAIISSFSLPHGLLAWGLTFPVLFVKREPGKLSLRWFAAWAALCALCATFYFSGYHKPSDLPPFAPDVSAFGYVQYVLAFLGSGLGRAGNSDPLAWSTAIGAITMLLYFAAIAHVLKRRDRALTERAVPWIAIALYSIGSACLAALGRIGWGVAQALESRYVAFSLYLFVGVIGLWAVLLSAQHSDAPGRRLVRAAPVFAGVLTACALLLHVRCSVASLELFRIRGEATRLGHAAVLFSQVIDTSATTKDFLYPRPDFMCQQAAALDQLHLLKPPLVRTRNVNDLRHSIVDDKAASGWFDRIVPVAEQRCVASGWTMLRTKKQPADAVVLAYSVGGEPPMIFALSDAIESRPDVARSLNVPREAVAGWRATFARNAIPNGALITAWAFDAREMRLFRLKENTAETKL